LGGLFQKTVLALKSVAWTAVKEKAPWKRAILVKTSICLIVGVLRNNISKEQGSRSQEVISVKRIFT
jgi:hypothetical protein